MRHRAGHAVPAAISRWMKRRCALVRRQIERHQFPGPLRHHGREPDAHARRASARGRDHARRGQGQSAGARRRRRLQHRTKSSNSRASSSAWAPTASSPSRLTTTSPRRKACISTTRRSPSAIRLPIIVYSVQGRTGVNVEPATLARLAEIENIVGVKEASGNIAQMANVIHEVPAGFHRALGRRCHHDPADRARRPRRHLGGHRTRSRPR